MVVNAEIPVFNYEVSIQYWGGLCIGMKHPCFGSLQLCICLYFLIWGCNIVKRWELRTFLLLPCMFSTGNSIPQIHLKYLSLPPLFSSGYFHFRQLDCYKLRLITLKKKKSLRAGIFLLREFWVKLSNDKFSEWRVSRKLADMKNSGSSLGVGLLWRFKSPLLPGPVTLLIFHLPWLQYWWFSWLAWKTERGLGMGQARIPQKLSVLP